ncbi:MAG: hypothetical protein ACHQ01_11120, partial [Candidatus Limnocylindrales bacterium]
MTTPVEAPAVIQYACERCKTRFVLPPSSRKLGLGGKLRAFAMGAGRTFRYNEGLGAGYDTARQQLLAKVDDAAYQSFVQSFRFCHECRQFVCNECWSTSRRSCLTCVAKSMTGAVEPLLPAALIGPEIPRPVVVTAAPRGGRLRRDATLVALAIALVLLAFEGSLLLSVVPSGPTSPVVAYGPISPSPSPAASQHQVEASTSRPSARPDEGPSAGSSAGLTEVGGATMTPTSGPTQAPNSTVPPTRTPTPTPT